MPYVKKLGQAILGLMGVFFILLSIHQFNSVEKPPENKNEFSKLKAEYQQSIKQNPISSGTSKITPAVSDDGPKDISDTDLVRNHTLESVEDPMCGYSFGQVIDNGPYVSLPGFSCVIGDIKTPFLGIFDKYALILTVDTKKILTINMTANFLNEAEAMNAFFKAKDYIAKKTGVEGQSSSKDDTRLTLTYLFEKKKAHAVSYQNTDNGYQVIISTITYEPIY